jgi:quinohemoprotein ethanol dehydrogenase
MHASVHTRSVSGNFRSSRPFGRALCLLSILLGCAVARCWSAPLAGDVSDGRVTAEMAGDNWLVKGGGYYQAQYSALKDINDKNVDGLGFAWSTELPDPMGLAAEPIAVDGVIYLSGPRSLVYAIDGASGKILWTFDPHIRLDWSLSNSWIARTNRGVAVWAGKVYVGTGDCRLIAIDAAKGSQIWQSPVCDPKKTGINGAPRVAGGRVFMGYAAESYKRGAIAAFDAETGKERWRCGTVPGDPARGSESPTLAKAARTWRGKQWWTAGGGGVWDPITFDPQTGLVLFGTSKTPSADFSGKNLLGGARLFTGSIVAVHAQTGEYAWHYQASTAERQTEIFHIVLADVPIDGRPRHVAISVPRTGTFLVLDATTGELLKSKPLVPQSDPQELVAAGAAEMDYPGLVVSGTEGCPDRRCFGVRNWWPMSYSPETRLTYIPIMDIRRNGVVTGALPMVGRLIAWDLQSQKIRWSVEQAIVVNSGVLSTGGNLVFQGQGTGEFDAYAADSGRKLWSIQTGSAIDAVPITYRTNGAQYVIVPVGWASVLRLFASSSMTATQTSRYGPARLLAFKLGATASFPTPLIAIPPVPRPPAQIFSKESVKRGRDLADRYGCQECHSDRLEGSGRWVENGGIPDLRYMPARAHAEWYAIVLGGSHRQQGMMPFGIDPVPAADPMTPMTAAQADDIHAYVIDRAWAAYDAQQKK